MRAERDELRELHHACVELFTGLHLAGRELLVPLTVVAEVVYLLAREADAEVEAMFLGLLADGDVRSVDLVPDDSGARPISYANTTTCRSVRPMRR